MSIVISTGRWKRSTRLAPLFRNAATELDAVASRTLSIPADMDGNEMPASNATTATTISISIRVTPVSRGEGRPRKRLTRVLLSLPADDTGVDGIAAGLPIGPIRDDVRFIAVLPGIAVDVGTPPRIDGNVLWKIGAH